MSTTRYSPRTFSPLIRAGAGNSEVNAAFRQGRAVRLARGQYVLATAWKDAPPWVRFEMAAAAESLANPGTVFCGETAVYLHGLPVWVAPLRLEYRAANSARVGRQVEVFAARGPAQSLRPPPYRFGHRHRLDQAQAHGPGHIDNSPSRAALDKHGAGAGTGTGNDGGVGNHAVVQAGHFLTIPLPQAIVEVLATQPLQRSLVVADAALRAEFPAGISRTELTAVASAWPIKTQASRALSVLQLASGLAESPGESRSRALLIQAGFCPPVLQYEFSDDAGFIGRCDFWWPECGVVGEFDGRAKWAGELVKDELQQWEVVHAAQERHARLAAHSQVKRVVHWVGEDLEDPEVFFAKLERAGVRRDPRRRVRAA